MSLRTNQAIFHLGVKSENGNALKTDVYATVIITGVGCPIQLVWILFVDYKHIVLHVLVLMQILASLVNLVLICVINSTFGRTLLLWILRKKTKFHFKYKNIRDIGR